MPHCLHYLKVLSHLNLHIAVSCHFIAWAVAIIKRHNGLPIRSEISIGGNDWAGAVTNKLGQYKNNK